MNDEAFRAELLADRDRPLTPREVAAQAKIREWNIGYASRPCIGSDGKPFRQDPAIVAIREGKTKGNKIHGTGYKGQEADPLKDPEFVKEAKACGLSPEDAVKLTKLCRPPEK